MDEDLVMGISYCSLGLYANRKLLVPLVLVAFVSSLTIFVQDAKADSITFTSDTTITTNMFIAPGEVWTINAGVTLTISPGVFINSPELGGIINYGTIINRGEITNTDGLINNNGIINNNGDGFITEDTGTFLNSGTINNGGGIDNEGGSIANSGTINNSGHIFANIDNSGTINSFCTGQISGTISGNAAIDKCATGYNVALFENGGPSDGIVNLNQPVTAVASSSDFSVNHVHFKWINPMGITVRDVTVAGNEDTFAPNSRGQWLVEATFLNGVQVIKTIQVSFQVLPESPIGAIAGIGSSLGAFAGYMFLKHRRSTTP